MTRTALTVAVGVFALLSCAPPTLYRCRANYPALLSRLEQTGGSLNKVLRPRSAEELSSLWPGRRYRYVVTAEGTLLVAPRPMDEKDNEYTHPVLARGEAVRAAGMLRFERRGAEMDDVLVMDRDSKSYCPPPASLVEARAAAVHVGVLRDHVRVEDKGARCIDGATTMQALPPEPPDGGA